MRASQPVLLYATAGNPKRWDQPSGVVEGFVRHIKTEARQPEQRFPYQFGKRDWEHYFGHVSTFPPALPADIAEIMNSPCPFWAGNKVRDTHWLVLIPKYVKRRWKALTLDYLGKLIQSPQGGGHGTQYRYHADSVREAIESQGPGGSYWVLMTRDVLPGSRWHCYEDQRKLVAYHAARTGLGYQLPSALEASVVMLLHYVMSGARLYSDNPWTYTRCRDNSTAGYPVAVGGFSSEGLYVGPLPRLVFGVAVLRKF